MRWVVLLGLGENIEALAYRYPYAFTAEILRLYDPLFLSFLQAEFPMTSHI